MSDEPRRTPQRLEYLPRCEAEIAEAVLWLENNRGSEVADRFLADLERTEDDILKDPYFNRIFTGGTRVRKLEVFSYQLVYVIYPELILGVAVMHTARRPGYWLDRMEGLADGREESSQ